MGLYSMVKKQRQRLPVLAPAKSRPAGDFATWLSEMRKPTAPIADRTPNVPCDGCNVCCKSFITVHVTQEDTASLARIPAKYLSVSPDLPEGDLVMAPNAQGHCPMLVDDACSIYADRPRSCRDFDCRIFAAAGCSLEHPPQAGIAERVAEWQFSYATKQDRLEHEAVRRATAYLWENAHRFPAGVLPTYPIALVRMAIRISRLFSASHNGKPIFDDDALQEVILHCLQSEDGVTPSL